MSIATYSVELPPSRSSHDVICLQMQPVVVVYDRKGGLYDEIALPRVEASVLDRTAPACVDL